MFDTIAPPTQLENRVTALARQLGKDFSIAVTQAGAVRVFFDSTRGSVKAAYKLADRLHVAELTGQRTTRFDPAAPVLSNTSPMLKIDAQNGDRIYSNVYVGVDSGNNAATKGRVFLELVPNS